MRIKEKRSDDMKSGYKAGVVKIIGVFLAVFIIAGCSPEFMRGGAPNHDDLTPYATEQQLEEISNQNGNVHWKVSRFFALLSLQEMAGINNWYGARLSEYPVIIYNSQTGNPRYYEFRVRSANALVGAISCNIRKTEGDPVQYILDTPHAFAEASSRSVSNKDAKVIDKGYPARMLVKSANSGRAIDSETGEEEHTEFPVDMKVKDMLEQADRETLAQLGIDSDETFNAYMQAQTEEEERLENLWKAIDGAQEEILALTEEEIRVSTAPEQSSRAVLVYSSPYLLAGWYDKRNWYTPGLLYCGPNVVGFITLGLGAQSGYPNVPLNDDRTALLNMYRDYENLIGIGARLFCELDDGLRARTHYRIETQLFHDWNTVDKNIRSSGLPSISLRSSTLDSLAWHYRAIIGTRQDRYRYDYTFLWWSWSTYSNVNWYYMHDNGSDGSNWWEQSGRIYQFQTGRVLPK